MSFKPVTCETFRLEAGVAWGSINIIAKGGKLLCTVWSAVKEPSMEQVEANARAIVAGLGGKVRGE